MRHSWLLIILFLLLVPRRSLAQEAPPSLASRPESGHRTAADALGVTPAMRFAGTFYEREDVLHTVTWVSVGVLGAGMVIGIGALVFRELAVDDWNSDACLAGGFARRENCGLARADAEGAEVIALVGMGLGIAGAVGVGTASAIRWPFARGRVRVAGGPGDAGMTLGVSF